MRYLLLVIAIAGLLATAGCASQQQQAYRWQYRAGTMYEYNKLVEVYNTESGNPPPLPPLSDVPGEGSWVKVPLRDDAVVVYDEYHPHGRVVIVDDPYYNDWYHPRTYVGTSYFYSPHRRYRGSSISIGFGFGSPGRYHGPFGPPYGHFGRPGYGAGRRW